MTRDGAILRAAACALADRPRLGIAYVHEAVLIGVQCPEGECVHTLAVCAACHTATYLDHDGCCDAPDRVAEVLGIPEEEGGRHG